MSCYHPYLGRPSFKDGVNEEGKYKYNIVGWFDPSVADPKDIRIPCGKCIGCRLDYSRQWADRMMLELQHHDGKAIFATLTYNNENVPIACDDNGVALGLTLDRSDISQFMKVLRSRKKFEDREIRFYACGEYGSNTRRPHCHAIIFGVDLFDFAPLQVRGHNELGQMYYVSEEFTGIWKKGFTLISEVSWRTCAYVSRYVMKKAYADDIQWYQEPEFSQMSRRPGIGSYYFSEHPECIEENHIYLSSKDGSVKVGIPKYFMDKLKFVPIIVDKETKEKVKRPDLNPFYNPELYDRIMSEKKEFANDKILLKMQKTDLSYVEQLEIEENLILDKVDILNKIRL